MEFPSLKIFQNLSGQTLWASPSNSEANIALSKSQARYIQSLLPNILKIWLQNWYLMHDRRQHSCYNIPCTLLYHKDSWILWIPFPQKGKKSLLECELWLLHLIHIKLNVMYEKAKSSVLPSLGVTTWAVLLFAVNRTERMCNYLSITRLVFFVVVVVLVGFFCTYCLARCKQHQFLSLFHAAHIHPSIYRGFRRYCIRLTAT